jgi:hypothetical protein
MMAILSSRLAAYAAAVATMLIAIVSIFARGRASAQQEDELAALRKGELQRGQVSAIEKEVGKPGAAPASQQLREQFSRD